MSDSDLIKIRKEVCEGDLIPNGYGISYVDYISYKAICYPIPFNFIVSIFRQIYIKLSKGPSHLLEIDRSVYEKARLAGFEEGFHEGFHEGMRLWIRAKNEEQVKS